MGRKFFEGLIIQGCKIVGIIILLTFVLGTQANIGFNNVFPIDNPQDTIKNKKKDSIKLKYPIPPEDPTKFGDKSNTSGLYLKDPKNIKSEIVYDPETNQYIYKQNIGTLEYRQPKYLDFDDYQKYDFNSSMQKYWKSKSSTGLGLEETSLIPKIHVGGEAFDRIFGGSTIDIRPQGAAELIFGINATRRDDPALDVKQRRNANFDFDQKIQMNVVAKIGDKIELGANYNTEATFEFENKTKLQYEGKEDEIIKKIELGDVTLPLPGSLITGSQALFGIKTELQFGKTTVTTVLSQQKSQTSTIEVSGGSQTSTFTLKADDYEENKHFFIAQYFQNRYNDALATLPLINSRINITKIEVWVTNSPGGVTENRNIVGFMDLGESQPYNSNFTPAPGNPEKLPYNRANNLYELMNNAQVRNINTVSSYLSSGVRPLVSGVDYEKIENARKLLPNEYTFNSKLGFISLNSALNADQVLGVAFQYSIVGDTTTYQVGDFSNEGIAAPQALIVKLLKSTALNTRIPLWNLMMKNVYAIGGYQINNQDFRLDVLYSSEENGVPTGFISEGNISGIPLIRVLNCDNLNTQNDPTPDGIFDFIDRAATEGGTIQASNGRIFFPVLQPFGKDLRSKFDNQSIADKYAFDSLYTMTKNGAEQYPDKNRFFIEGRYKSSSGSEIPLNAINVPQGSVKVTSGGIPLTENVDYTVDYTLGRVKIINEGILNSGSPIQISMESQNIMSFQQKTLLGTHVNYKVNKDFNLGGTIMNLTERPITSKINYGEEPISNTIWGLNSTYQTDVNLVTKIIDKLPFYNTKAVSKLTLNSEMAHLIPGHARAIGKGGVSYIDDFEGSKSSIDLKNVGAWSLASTPQGQNMIFPEAAIGTGLAYGFNRAKLAWYVIDPSVFYDRERQPTHIRNDREQLSNHFVREIPESEVFPNKENPNNIPTRLAVFNLAYYPSEKGPYNYDVEGMNSDGTLKFPERRWGGIMRKLETTDFEATNVEYIEFWLMDPFVYDQNHPGGELCFNLGDISEDILRDGRKSFENGLPISAEVVNVDTTIWGRVPKNQMLVNTFDNNPASREFQDVGLDGLRNTDERSFFAEVYLQKVATKFGTNSVAYQKAFDDPSSDDFHYFRGTDYDNAQTSILERYKKYNGLEGNSPTSEQSTEEYPTQASTLPNMEDINRDNTLSEAERYFQYKIHLSPENMIVGQNHIADVYEAPVTLKNGTSTTIKWYQFKVPIQNPEKIVGNIQDFKSIRFIRMYLRNFSKPIVCRFATLELVRGQWRKYNYSLLAPGEYITNDNLNETIFNSSTVNIEENGKRVPVPYVLPPGIYREINITSTNNQQLNEQSLSLKVCNLQDGDARAIYKTADLDVRQFQRLQMYIHAEASNQNEPLSNGDLTCFIRLGTDFTKNYYEYEVPLTFTPWNTSATDVEAIWPQDNMINLEFELLQAAKLARNMAIRNGTTSIGITDPYIMYDGKNKITVVGTPNLSSVKTIMIGIRNPKKKTFSDKDDGLKKCAEVWVNELRLTDFNEQGGWAANTRANLMLADIGTLALAGTISTPGFGSIDKKVNERQKEQITSYDIATNIELGKFLPEKSGIKIPMHFDYNEIISNPQYNPMNPDILFKEDLRSYEDRELRDSVREIAQDYTRRKSLNFMNVKKDRVGASTKTRFYDVENLDLTYAYTEIYKRNFDIEYNLAKTYMGAIGYNFNNNPKNYKPFAKSKLLKPKSLQLVRDFNFYLMPKLVSMRTEMNRGYAESLLRSKSNAIILIEPNYVKSFNWTRLYDVKWDLTQNLKIDFNANMNARIDEPPGIIDKSDRDYQQKRDSILTNIRNFGRPTQYTQTSTVNYNLPLNKIGIINWVTASARYSADYSWNAATLATQNLGNTIENSNTKQINLGGNLVTLYNKIDYLKKINQKTTAPTTPAKNPAKPPATPEPEKKDTTKKQINYFKIAFDNTLRVLMGVRNVSFNYSEGNGTLMPGFMHSPQAFGKDWNLDAPTTGFVFGSQEDIRQRAVENNWLSRDSLLNSAYATKYNNNLSGRASIEPIPFMKIELTATRNYSENHREYFRPDSLGNFRSFNPMQTGNFSISFITWNTAWVASNKTDYSNANFEKFKEYRKTIAIRLAEENRYSSKAIIDSTGFPDGYGPTAQQVIIPAFIAAYIDGDPSKIMLDPFPKIPLPNWRITYDGLTKIKYFKKYFKTFSVSHSYKSTYNVGSFATNVMSRTDEDGVEYARNALQNFIANREINQISISEQFSPLLNFDMTWNNSLMTKVEIKKSRDLGLSLTNNQLTEVNSSAIVVGAGYRIKDVTFDVKSGGKTNKIKSDMNIKADVSFKKNQTIIRKLVEDVNQISAGQNVISINTSVDYKVSQYVMLKAFFDKIITNPFISSQFPNANTNAGISIRLSLAQ